MQLEHSFTVPVGIDEAWRILLDIERIGPCMPGAAIETVHGDEFTGTVKVKLGPINLTYKGKASFIEKDEVARRAVIDARGKDARGNGTASAKVSADLSDEGGNTKVVVVTDLDITGKPAQFGRGVMVDVGNKLIGQFADNLAHAIAAGEIPVAGAADAPASAAAAAAAGNAAADTAAAKARPKPVRKAAARSAGKPEAEPTAASEPAAAGPAAAEPGAAPEPGAESEPVGVPESAAAAATSVNGHAASTPRQLPPRDVEPINLVHHAGPAVAKRLAPLVLALVIVLVAVRRLRRRRG